MIAVAPPSRLHRYSSWNQTLINETLKSSLQQSDMEAMIRQVIREELQGTAGHIAW